MRSASSLPKEYFDRLYHQSVGADPWEFRVSQYEADKYAATLDQLPRPRYRSALEVGCSIGVFTRRLADRVEDLLAIDLSEAALTQAKALCRDQPHVRFALVDLLAATPPGRFDLIVVSEVAYYWSPADFGRVFRGLVQQLAPAGQIILVHWRASVPDYPQTGDDVHGLAEQLAGLEGLKHAGRWIKPKYRSDLWEREERTLSARPTEADTASRQSRR